ncbi:hypothetical protein QBC35DRAFT_232823 [Podospora australis]|uniref:Cytochrome b5 heme-binding domain-containing protein n=1 Tax=Podospora australis TaxID=1536484 RepID=A0AAN7AIR0_9PEZI|nr:hypothetical protein QBC35DRAFT_232823 [Podospora australis]
MALLGISLIVASVVLFCMRRPRWLPSLFGSFSSSTPQLPPASSSSSSSDSDRKEQAIIHDENHKDEKQAAPTAVERDRAAMPPPPPPPPPSAFVVTDPSESATTGDDEQTTPKASAATLSTPVPSFSLSAPAPPSVSAPRAPQPPPPSNLMPPPPRPSALRPSGSSSLSPAATTSRLSPAPARGPGCSTLAPPPTHSSKPAKPSRQVILTPGHSPLDWARLSGSPNADLRGLPPGTPYLKVPPSLLKKYTGRKGKDCWTVLNGKVYNLTPYIPFHPGGEPELLRCAGRDGTKLFGEIHPWVNYEGMLAACLIGIFVTEEEEQAMAKAAAAVGVSTGSAEGDMEAMD